MSGELCTAMLPACTLCNSVINYSRRVVLAASDDLVHINISLLAERKWSGYVVTAVLASVEC